MKTPYAKLNLENVLSFSEFIPACNAEKGKDYYCPDCNSVVRRRISSKGLAHFYHLGVECSGGGLETTLHLLAKSLLEKYKKIWIPNCITGYKFFLPSKDSCGKFHRPVLSPKDISTINKNQPQPYFYEVCYLPSNFNPPKPQPGVHIIYKNFSYGLMDIEAIEIEKSLDIIRPDIYATINGKKHLIEIANTHFVDSEKLAKIRYLDIPSIEINISTMAIACPEELLTLLIKPNRSTSWLHYSNQLLTDFAAESETYIEQYIAQTERNFTPQEKIKHQQFQSHANQIQLITPKAWEKGMPKLIGSEVEVVHAKIARSNRINRFGKDDYLVQTIASAHDWLLLSKSDELYKKEPALLKKYFNVKQQP
ncbi:competence protein CoiA family protein [Hydrogenovibrio kuenenii]|uniref:hypothetical protein n=1 Tax=Hydrogenovibrio kuenenii TaxID=63658 RepID=UPI000463C65A|nr:hypothetical protein [Hydrogenovibrio kuenenii]